MAFAEESLDPQNWDELRALAHRMVDDMLTYLQTVRERPAWQPMPDQVKEHLQQPLPLEPQGVTEAYQDFVTNVLPYPLGNIHPRFWGWVIGTGTPFGVLAEMLAATMNPNMGGGDHVANDSNIRCSIGAKKCWAFRTTPRASWSAAARWRTLWG